MMSASDIAWARRSMVDGTNKKDPKGFGYPNGFGRRSGRWIGHVPIRPLRFAPVSRTPGAVSDLGYPRPVRPSGERRRVLHRRRTRPHASSK